MTTFNVKIIKSVLGVKEKNYPYWATDINDDLYLVTRPEKAIAVQYWTTIDEISEDLLIPLKSGDKIEIIVK